MILSVACPVKSSLSPAAMIEKGELLDVSAGCSLDTPKAWASSITFAICCPGGIGYSLKTPKELTLPILLAAYSVNQILPSGPVVMPEGWQLGVGISNCMML